MQLRVTEKLSPMRAAPVLSALEHHLQSIALIVDQHQGVVTAFGIGPESTCQNPADVAVFEVFEGTLCTVIEAVIHYDESHAAAKGSRQPGDVPVEEKIRSILERVRADLKLTRREPSSIRHPSEDSLVRRPAEAAEAQGQQEPWPKRERAEEAQSAKATSVPVRPGVSGSYGHLRRAAALILLGTAAATLGALAAQRLTFRANRATLPPPVHAVARSAVVPANFPYSPQSAAKSGSDDLRQWVAAWIAAVRSRNARAQASFYCDRVDDYLGIGTVSRRFILRERTAAVHARARLWTVRVDRMRVEEQGPSRATLTLTTDTIEKAPESGPSERFVNTRLKLKKVDNSWKIVEQEIVGLPRTEPLVNSQNVAASVRQDLVPGAPSARP